MRNVSQRSAVVAFVVGTLAVPALVLASTALLARDAAPRESAAAITRVEHTVIEAPVATTTSTAPEPDPGDVAVAADLALACGTEGAGLVALETAGEITPLEQAALDALRPICAEAGMPLAEPVAPEPVVIIETVMTRPAPSPAPPAASVDHDDDHDDHGEDDDHDDDHDDEDDD